MQAHMRLDGATAAALQKGDTVRVTYASGFTHRLRVEKPWPPMPSMMLNTLLEDAIRRPRDIYAESSVAKAERLVQREATRRGAFVIELSPPS